MEPKDLSDKKINNTQQLNEGFSGENLPENYNPAKAKSQTEHEVDADGQHKTVTRNRFTDEHPPHHETGLEDNQTRQAVENRDRNSDPAHDRYDADHPDNRHNRGNLDLDA